MDELRVSDQDRDRTAEVVREAASEGRLDLTETEQRLEQVFGAKTYRDLARTTEDLPNAHVPASRGAAKGRKERSAALPERGPDEIAAVFQNERWHGEWLVPPRLRLRAICGEIKVDLTEATLPQEVSVDVQVVLAQVTLYVPDDIAVVFDSGPTVLGERKNRTHAAADPGAPLVRVSGSVLLGELTARPPRRRWGLRRRG